jgi:hypothetical protein
MGWLTRTISGAAVETLSRGRVQWVRFVPGPKIELQGGRAIGTNTGFLRSRDRCSQFVDLFVGEFLASKSSEGVCNVPSSNLTMQNSRDISIELYCTALQGSEVKDGICSESEFNGRCGSEKYVIDQRDSSSDPSCSFSGIGIIVPSYKNIDSFKQQASSPSFSMMASLSLTLSWRTT